MPKVYLVSEADREGNPWMGSPECCLLEPVDWSSEFEEWYAGENYALIDNDGCSYRLVWSDATGFSIVLERQSDELRALFYAWLRVWIATMRPALRDKLQLPPGDWRNAELVALINDESRARCLAG